MKMVEPTRLDKIKKTVDDSWTPIQFQHRRQVYKDVKDAFLEFSNKDDLYINLHENFPAWCAVFVDDDSGNPLIPSPWQTEFAQDMQDYSYLFALCSRKIGKSTNLAAINAWYLCGFDKERIICFAPTHGQDFIYRKARKYVSNNDFLKENFLKTDTTEGMESALTGTEVINRSLAISTGGETARGEYATMVLVDEVQSIPPYVMNQIIMPMAADAYSDKRISLIGTPSDVVNPDLEILYDNWDRRDPKKYKKTRIDCWVGIEEGCLTESWVVDQFYTLSDDEFRMEYGGKFPLRSMRFFPPQLIENQVRPYGFPDDPNPNFRYVMSIDWAQESDNTEFLIGEYDNRSGDLRYTDHVCFEPDAEFEDGQRVSYLDKIIEAQKTFWRWGVTWICPDSTTTQIAISQMLLEPHRDPRTGKKIRGIPEKYFYGWERGAKKQKLGYFATAPMNSDMWTNHKDMLEQGRILLPEYEPAFLKKYKRQHVELQQQQSAAGYVRLKEQKNSKKDLAVAAGYMSLFLKDKGPKKAHNNLVGFKATPNTRKPNKKTKKRR